MSLLHIATRSPAEWRSRLGNPEKHWKRGASALETAVSWETAAKSKPGLPMCIANVFRGSELGEVELLLAVAEHKVALAGSGGDSQCDVWALVRGQDGVISVSVEAKAKESFGASNESLETWLTGGTAPGSVANRANRWLSVQKHLPIPAAGNYAKIPYQILHRCAAAVIEAHRFGLKHAVFLVQAFDAPDKSFEVFSHLLSTLGQTAEKGVMQFSEVDGVKLGIAWVDDTVADDHVIAKLI